MCNITATSKQQKKPACCVNMSLLIHNLHNICSVLRVPKFNGIVLSVCDVENWCLVSVLTLINKRTNTISLSCSYLIYWYSIYVWMQLHPKLCHHCVTLLMLKFIRIQTDRIKHAFMIRDFSYNSDAVFCVDSRLYVWLYMWIHQSPQSLSKLAENGLLQLVFSSLGPCFWALSLRKKNVM